MFLLSFLRERIYHCIYNIITLKCSSYGNRNGNVHKNNELVILKIKLKTFSIIQYWKPQKYEAKISRVSFDPFGKFLSKDLGGILNFQRFHSADHISVPAHLSISADSTFRETKDLFSRDGKWGNGGAGSGQLQWLFLTFDPARSVTECPMSTIHRELSWYDPTARPLYNWRAAKFVSYQCKRRAHVKFNLDMFSKRNIFEQNAIF